MRTAAPIIGIILLFLVGAGIVRSQAAPSGTYLPLVVAPVATPTVAPTAIPTLQPTAQPTAQPTTQPQPTQRPGNCAAEYPTVCIPPPPPDLNCPDIPYRNFTVLAPDRHKFDTDNDGIGCETANSVLEDAEP